MRWDNGWHDGSGAWSWLMMLIMMAVFWGGLAWVVVTLVRHGTASRPAAGPNHTIPPAPQGKGAEEILHDRLARGEVDIDEYHARIDALRAKRPG